MRHLELLLVVCCTLAACGDSLPVPGDFGARVDAGRADGPAIRDTGTVDGPSVRDTGTVDGPSTRDTGTADAPADAGTADAPADAATADGPVDQGADTSSDASVPTACIFDDPSALFGSCLFDP